MGSQKEVGVVVLHAEAVAEGALLDLIVKLLVDCKERKREVKTGEGEGTNNDREEKRRERRGEGRREEKRRAKKRREEESISPRRTEIFFQRFLIDGRVQPVLVQQNFVFFDRHHLGHGERHANNMRRRGGRGRGRGGRGGRGRG
jgi:hypothetical protein